MLKIIVLSTFALAMVYFSAEGKSETKIACCTEGNLRPKQIEEYHLEALDGSIDASDKLCFYYIRTPLVADAYINWLRIGAENNSTSCMFQLYQTLSTSTKFEDHRRARYWLKRLVDLKYPNAALIYNNCKNLQDTTCYGPMESRMPQK